MKKFCYINSQKNNLYSAGFTLLEVVTVVSILTILTTVTLSADVTSLRKSSFRDTQKNLIGTLQKARTEAINNVCFGNACAGGLPHGVHFDAHSYVLYQGSMYDPTATENTLTTLDNSATLFGMTDILFTPLSGDAITSPPNISYVVLSDTIGHVSTTSISYVGQIFSIHN